MRNLKRALSLALASVMLLGMMVVGAGAAQSYPDVDDSYNTEAIDVLKTVNVMTGYAEDGNFHPDDTVNRAMMARVMAELMNLDYDYYEAIPSQFTDVTGNYSWAKKYVDACAANGIVVGRGAGIYDPAAGVTAVEAASMMMRALGYFQHSGDYNGGFEAATVSQASRISLFSGINGNANDALNRNQVAKLALNTLEANMVDFTGDMGFEYNGLSVGYRSEYTYRSGSEDKYKAISSLGDATDLKNGNQVQGQYYVQLGEQLYGGNLKKVDDNDGFGAPANTWSYKNTKIGTYNKTPDYVLEGKVKSSVMYDTVGADVAKNYEWVVKVDGADNWYDDSGDETVYIFGSNENDPDDIRKQVADNNNDDLAGTGRGTVTSVYLSNDTSDAKKFHGTATVTVVNTYAGEVAQVETKDGVTTVTVSDMEAGTDLSFEVAGCEEDDVVLYSKYQEKYGDGKWSAGKVLGLAGHVQGEATTIRNEEHVVVDGDTYYYNRVFNPAGGEKLGVASVGYEVAFYIDFQDNIVMIDSAIESYDYAVVVDVGYAPNQYADKTTYGATLVLSDGTIKEVILDGDMVKDILDNDGKLTRAATGDPDKDLETLKDALVGRVFAYRENDNGRFTLSPAKNKETGDDADESALLWWEEEEENIVKSGSSQVKKPTDEHKKGGGYIYANSNTVFMINDVNDDPDEFSVYVGYSKLPEVNAIEPVTVGEGDDAITYCTALSYYQDPNRAAAGVIVITDAEVSGSINDVIFLVGDTDPEVQQTGSEKYYVYDAVVNGEPTTLEILTVSNAADKAAKVGKGEVGVYYGMATDKNGRVKDLTMKEPEDSAVNGVKELAYSYTNLTRWTGFKRTSNEVMSFEYDKVNNKYGRTVAAADKMTIARRNTDGTIEKLSALPTDTNDQAVVVTDAGRAVAIFIWAYDQGVDPTATPEGAPDTYSISAVSGLEFSKDNAEWSTTLSGLKEGDTVYVKITNSDYTVVKLNGKVIDGSFEMPAENLTSANFKLENDTSGSIEILGGEATIDYEIFIVGDNTKGVATITFPDWIPEGGKVLGKLAALNERGTIDLETSGVITFEKPEDGNTDTQSFTIAGFHVDGTKVILGESTEAPDYGDGSTTVAGGFAADKVIVEYVDEEGNDISDMLVGDLDTELDTYYKDSSATFTTTDIDLNVTADAEDVKTLTYSISGLNKTSENVTDAKIDNPAASPAFTLTATEGAKGNGPVTITVKHLEDLEGYEKLTVKFEDDLLDEDDGVLYADIGCNDFDTYGVIAAIDEENPDVGDIVTVTLTQQTNTGDWSETVGGVALGATGNKGVKVTISDGTTSKDVYFANNTNDKEKTAKFTITESTVLTLTAETVTAPTVVITSAKFIDVNGDNKFSDDDQIEITFSKALGVATLAPTVEGTTTTFDAFDFAKLDDGENDDETKVILTVKAQATTTANTITLKEATDKASGVKDLLGFTIKVPEIGEKCNSLSTFEITLLTE